MIFKALHGERVEVAPGADDGAKVAIHGGSEATIRREDFPALAAFFGQQDHERLGLIGSALDSMSFEPKDGEDIAATAIRFLGVLDRRIAKEQGE